MNKNLLLTLLAAGALTTQSFAQTLVGITNNNEVFRIANVSTPNVITTPIAVTGIATGQNIVGADFRPNTGELYLMGYNATTTTAQLYTLNYTTGVATPVTTTTVVLALGTGSISFDFNPTVDRIRVMGSNGKNYRLHPVTGAIAATDLDLAYATGDANAAATPYIGAAAYTNSYIGTEATALYDYDENLNVLALQNPPNNGTLNTIGATGINVNTTNRRVDMDVWFNPATKTNVAYLAANAGTIPTDNLYTINTTTGAATLLGSIGVPGTTTVKDIAMVIDRTLPATITGQMVYALTKTNKNLITFDSDLPGTIRSWVTPSGLTAGQTIVGMDIRPEDRQLYALGYNSTNSTYQLYRLNTTTGVATAINATAGTLSLGSGNVGFDFNPTVDRIRVVSNGSNYRLNPITGDIAATDTALAFATGDANNGRPARVGSVSYVNSYRGATATTLYGVDDSAGVFVSVAPPNGGVVNTISALTGIVNPADYTTDIDFYYDSASSTNRGFLVANPTTVNDNFYTITTAGVTTLQGTVGYGIPVADIAVQLTYTGGFPTAVRNTGYATGISIYPNPVQNQCIISLPQTATGDKHITITDNMGKTVWSTVTSQNGDITISINQLPAGMYIVNVHTASMNFAPLKLVKE